jgi:fructose-1-phosphate kinase PfkB-like protein
MIVIPSLATSRDVILHAPGWRRGSVTRAARVIVTAGGKPLNVARFLGAMGIECTLVLVADRALANAVAAALPSCVAVRQVITRTESRTDVAIVDGVGELTVVNGPPPTMSDDELDGALDLVTTSTGRDGILVVAGSQPDTAMASLLTIAPDASARVVLDVSGVELRDAAAADVSLVKVNAAELAEATGAGEDRAWGDAPTLMPGAESVVITRGAEGLRGWLADGRVVRVPGLEAPIVNPYGSGDAVTAALAAALTRGPIDDGALLDAAAWAVAVAGDPGLELDPAAASAFRAHAETIDEGRWERGQRR